MKLIVGLGNPGEKYENTRHNLGFLVLEHLLKKTQSVTNGNWNENKKLKSQVFIIDWESKLGVGEKVIFAKPQTYMNNSGMAVKLLSDFYKIDPSDIWIVHDELDLPLGSMKIRFAGSGAGHHGIESIINALGTEKFYRFRLGIGQSKHHDEMVKHNVRSAEDFVLDSFNRHEAGSMKHLVKRAVDALITALEKDITAAMNQFNTK